MTTLVSDSFNRAATTASSTALGNTDTGQTWVQETTNNLYFYINANGQAQASGNESFTAVNSGQSDVDVQCDLIPATTNANSGIMVRNDGSNESVSLFLRLNGGNLEFYEQGTTTSKLASQGVSYVAGSTQTLRIVASGSAITCYLNGTQTFNLTNVTENQTNTYHGLRFLDTSSADNFVVNSVGSGTPTPISASASFTGQGSLTSSANIINPTPVSASASFQGAGSLSSTASIVNPNAVSATADFQGQGSLNSTATVSDSNVTALTSFTGQGSLTSIPTIIKVTTHATTSFSGSSYMFSAPVIIAPAIFTHQKTWTANFDKQKNWNAVFDTSKTWTANFDTKKTWIGGCVSVSNDCE